MTRQRKLELLVKNYKKLEENKKDCILELLRKLVKIHCGRELLINTSSKEVFKG
jgi:hypothetical protein